MAQTQRTWTRMATSASEAGNASEGAGVLQLIHGTTSPAVAGTYSGLSVRLTSAVADTLTYRVYDAATVVSVASLGVLLHEFTVAFDAQADPALAEPGYPKPYYSGLVVTSEAAGGADRASTTTAMVEPIAGRRSA